MEALIRISGDSITVVQQDTGGAVKASVDGAKVDYGTNPATGKPFEGVPGYVSELASLLTGKVSTDPVKDTTTTGDKETRQQFALLNGMHIDIQMPTKRTVYELLRPSDGSRAEVAIHVRGVSGKLRVQLAGAKSGAVVGGASLGGAAGTIMEGALDSYDKQTSANGTVDINLRLDSGDSTVLLVLTPL